VTIKPFIQHCQLCGAAFRFGPSIYDGKHIARYNLTVCRGCFQGNWDGWGPMVEDAFLKHLDQEGITPPARNVGGWFPRD
jgi:hypothetical protein